MSLSHEETAGGRRGLRFSVRSMLWIAAVVGAYFAGWQSHRSWSQPSFGEVLESATKELSGNVQLEWSPTQTLLITGSQSDVDQVRKALAEFDETAKK